MDWKTLKDIVDEMVNLRMKIHILEVENKELRSELTKIMDDNDILKGEKEKYDVFCKNTLVDALNARVSVNDIIQTETKNITVMPIVEEKTVVIVEMTETQTRKEYMRNYMKEKRKKNKVEKEKLKNNDC